MKIRIIESESLTFVGLSTVCHLSELGAEIPKLWLDLERRKNEIKDRLDLNSRVGLFLGRNGDIFNEAVGFVVREHAPVPEGMIKVSVPPYRYAVISHRGPDVQNSYSKLFEWITEKGYQVAPYQEAFHHIEWYPENRVQESNNDLIVGGNNKEELVFDIYVRFL